MTWKDRAACHIDVAALFSTIDATSQEAVDTVTEFCDSCPVVVECHAWARGERFFEGIAAGLVWTPKRPPRRPPRRPADTLEARMRKAATRYTHHGHRDVETVELTRAYWRTKARRAEERPTEPNPFTVAHLINGTVHWRDATMLDREEAWRVMVDAGWAKGTAATWLGLNGRPWRRLVDEWEANQNREEDTA